MDEKKQIEELAHDMCGNFMSNGNCATDDEPCYLECVYGCCAEKLNCKDYRKQSVGEWIYHECVSSYDGLLSGYSCSCCSAFIHEEVFEDTSFPNKFCPNCGARMKGGEG